MSDPPAPSTEPGTDAATVTFWLDDHDHDLRGVRLWQEVRLPGSVLDFTWADGAWTVTVPRPAVDRMEYLFELTRADGSRETLCDPADRVRVGGAFGDHSVREFPEYRAPAWLKREARAGASSDLDIAAAGLAQNITGSLWTPAGLADDAPAGLLVVHDGPEYAHLAAFTRYLAVLADTGTVPPVRAALLAPGPRDQWYSASGAYSRALTGSVLPHLLARVPVTRVVGVGASLGALLMLMAHRRAPGAFDGLFLQSGSFFQRGLDEKEKGFSEFERITRNVAGVLASAGHRRPIPIVLTCGGIEENLGNNRAMRRALVAQGYPVVLREVRDTHNYTAWRDALDPHLSDLLRRVLTPVPDNALDPGGPDPAGANRGRPDPAGADRDGPEPTPEAY